MILSYNILHYPFSQCITRCHPLLPFPLFSFFTFRSSPFLFPFCYPINHSCSSPLPYFSLLFSLPSLLYSCHLVSFYLVSSHLFLSFSYLSFSFFLLSSQFSTIHSSLSQLGVFQRLRHSRGRRRSRGRKGVLSRPDRPITQPVRPLPFWPTAP